MKKTLIIGTIAVTAMVGCNLTPDTIPAGVDCGQEPTQTQAEAAAQVWVQHAGLKDPGSAQVRNVQILGKRGMYNGLVNGGGYSYGWMVQFEVNAKNSFGGYVGFKTRQVLRMPDGMVRWQMVLD